MRGDLSRLIEALRKLDSAVIAFSGGADSTLLLKAVKLAGIRALAVTGTSWSTPPWDIEDALSSALEIGVEHRIVNTSELENPLYTKNEKDRCFHCKDGLYAHLREIAEAGGYAHVLDGNTLDDLRDYRPGMAARHRHGVISPLMEAGLKKKDVREISRELGLSTWDKPSSPCLASRMPYGMRISAPELEKISRAESAMRAFGFREFRVRNHGDVARLEIAEHEFRRAVETRARLADAIRAAGFKFVSLDLEGFKSGNLNRLLLDE